MLNPKWQKSKKKLISIMLKTIDHHQALSDRRLPNLINKSVSEDWYKDLPIDLVEPLLMRWENQHVRMGLYHQGVVNYLKFENQYNADETFNWELFHQGNHYLSLHMLVNFTAINLSRFRYQTSLKIDDMYVQYIMNAFIAGDDVKELFVLYMDYQQRNSLIVGCYPLFSLMGYFLCKHYKFPDYEIHPETYDRELVDKALNVIDSENIEEVEKICLELCDLHTFKIAPTNDRGFYEYSNLNFGYFPGIYYLICCIREKRGLIVPKIQHPLVKIDWQELRARKLSLQNLEIFDKLKQNLIELDFDIKYLTLSE